MNYEQIPRCLYFTKIKNYYMQNFPQPIISRKTKYLIEKLLLGKLSLTEISQITGLSEQWIQHYIEAQCKGTYEQKLFWILKQRN